MYFGDRAPKKVAKEKIIISIWMKLVIVYDKIFDT